MDTDDQYQDKVTIRNKNGRLVTVTPVQDYTFRPMEYEDMTLYDWIHLYNNRNPKPKSKSCKIC